MRGRLRQGAWPGGTDGTDGPTDAAGAIADGTTAAQARELGIDPLHHLLQNNSYAFFKQFDAMTGAIVSYNIAAPVDGVGSEADA